MLRAKIGTRGTRGGKVGGLAQHSQSGGPQSRAAASQPAGGESGQTERTRAASAPHLFYFRGERKHPTGNERTVAGAEVHGAIAKARVPYTFMMH